jgi:hypothetical protein
MFIGRIISMLTHIVMCAMPIIIIVDLLRGLVFSLIKKSIQVSVDSLMLYGLLFIIAPILFIKGFAFVTYLHEKRFSHKIHALVSFLFAAVILAETIKSFKNFGSQQLQLSMILAFIVTGILFWKEIPEKILMALGGKEQ